MAYEIDPALLDWLLDTDPALRWQVERDLAGRTARRCGQATRARVATEGFGARLLALQDRRRAVGGRRLLPGRLRLRRARGGGGRGPAVDRDDLDAQHPARVGAGRRPRSRAPPSSSPRTAAGSTTTCPTGAARSTAASTPTPWPTAPGWAPTSPGSRSWFLEHRLADGGWNCEWVEGSTRSSFHSTLNTLKGLLCLRAGDRRRRRSCARPGTPARSTCWSAG